MKISSLSSAELKALAAFTFLLPVTIAPLHAQDAAPPSADVSPAAAAPTLSSDELRDQLIASVRADLLAKREKEENSTAVTALAQALEVLASLPPPKFHGPGDGVDSQQLQAQDRRASTWQTAVVAHGSEKSIDLGLRYNQRLQREADEHVAQRSAEIEAMLKTIAGQVFSAKTAAELDPLIEQVKPFTVHALGRVYIPPDLLEKSQQVLQFLTAWQSQMAERDAGNLGKALQVLRQFRSNQRSVPWVPRSELVKQLDAAERLAGLPGADEVTAAIQRVSAKALDANKGEALDPLLAEMRDLQIVLQTEESRAQLNKVQALTSFLEHWQKALILRETGNVEGLKGALRQLEGYGTRGLDIPRSKIIERVLAMGTHQEESADGKPVAPGKIEPPQAILDRVQRLEDLAPALTALNAAIQLLPENSRERFTWAEILQELRTTGQQYAELRNGFPGRVTPRINTSAVANPKVLALQRQLSLVWLQHLVGEEAAIAPDANESSVTYVRRMLVAAKERKNWRLVQRLIEIAQGTNVQDPNIRSTDSTAISLFITASTQERAGQFAFATASYLGALKTGSEWVSAEEIGERLRKIEKEHAADYAQGVEWARTSPVSNRDVFSPGYRPSTNPFGVQHPMAEQVLSGREKAPLLDIKVAEEEKKSVPETRSVGGEGEK